jgi:ABC-type nitrate/sulfonate/bicarbonate transport system permease component
MCKILGAVLFLFAWELNSRFGIVLLIAKDLPMSFFPSLASIASDVLATISDRAYIGAALVTIFRTLISFMSAVLIGTLFALLAARLPSIDELTSLPIEFFRQLPAVAIIPLAIITFGIYTPMKVAVAFFGCVLPIYVATRDGLRNVDPVLLLTAQAYKWSGRRLLFGIMLPSAAPQILSTARVVLAIALILIVMAEMLVGEAGLGSRLVASERSFDFATLYSETFLLGLIGVTLNFSFAIASKRIYFWHTESRWTGRPT